MATRYAWVINLDADLELARGPSYCPTNGVVRALAKLESSCAQALMAPGDLHLGASAPAGSARGYVGRAFCPTPRALARLIQAGAEPEPCPSAAVLRLVSSRAFAAALGQNMHDARYFTSLAEARAHLARAPESSDRWRIKRSYGMAGRGQRITSPAPRDADIAFLPKWLEEGGAQIEPNVAIACEYAQHGWLTPAGDLHTGVLTEQRVDPSGAWQSSQRVPSDQGTPELRQAIADAVLQAANALADVGYFGPFGVDAFTWIARDGAVNLRARSEVNARYSMGFAVGMAGSIPDR